MTPAKIKQFLINLVEGNDSGSSGICEHDIHLAAALLLVEIGQADFDWHESEIQTILQQLSIRFQLTEAEAKVIFEQAQDHESSQTSLYDTIKIINEHCSLEQKRLILTDCWRVAYTDGKIDRYEEHHLRKIAELLYLHHADFIQTKLKAEAEQNVS